MDRSVKVIVKASFMIPQSICFCVFTGFCITYGFCIYIQQLDWMALVLCKWFPAKIWISFWFVFMFKFVFWNQKIFKLDCESLLHDPEQHLAQHSIKSCQRRGREEEARQWFLAFKILVFVFLRLFVFVFVSLWKLPSWDPALDENQSEAWGWGG